MMKLERGNYVYISGTVVDRNLSGDILMERRVLKDWIKAGARSELEGSSASSLEFRTRATQE